MKRIYYLMALLLIDRLVDRVLFLRGGTVVHALAFVAVIFYLQAVIIGSKPKVQQ
jgi:hypothetical protein